MANTYWIKLYIEILDDPKMGMMPDWLFRRFIQLLLAAGENRNDGKLQPVPELAWRLRTDEKKLREALRALQEVGVVHEVETDVWLITNYKKRQDALTPAEKQKGYRERKRKEEYYQPQDASVTNSVTIRNTDTDTDTESESDVGAAQSSGEPPEPPTPELLISRAFTQATGIPEFFGGPARWYEALDKLVALKVTPDDIPLIVQDYNRKGFAISSLSSIVNGAAVHVARRNGGNGSSPDHGYTRA